jgi:hypothetical protein
LEPNDEPPIFQAVWHLDSLCGLLQLTLRYTNSKPNYRNSIKLNLKNPSFKEGLECFVEKKNC